MNPHAKERPTPSQTTVMLADDQPLLVSGLQRIIDTQPDMTVTGTASNGTEAIRTALSNPPDVILMDVRMPVLDGIQATKAIKDRMPEIKIVGLTSYDTANYLRGMVRAGASGFLLKDSSAEQFVGAIRAVALGNDVFADSFLHYVTVPTDPDEDSAVTAAPEPSHEATSETRLQGFSAREQQILTLITDGASNADIAHQLGISQSTVKGHVGNILSKLHMQDRTVLIIWAYRNGIAH